MPAQSQQQQKLFGLALSVKRGETPRSEASDEVLNIVNSMSEKEIEDFASTSHSGLPAKVESELRGVVREIMKERVLSEAASRTAMEIGALTGMNKDAVQKFVDTHNLDIEKLFKYVKAGKLKERMDFVAAVVGNPGNKIQKMIISKFGIKESIVSEGKFKVDDLVYNKRTKTVGIVRMGDDKYGEVKTDADGNVSVDELEKYNPIKFKHQTKAKVAPSTEKEVNTRGLFNPFKLESVNEGVSPKDMGKIKAAVEAASSFMNIGSELKKSGLRYIFATSPMPVYIVQPTPNNKVAIVNKKYASKPDFVIGDTAVGVMESLKKVNEEIKVGQMVKVVNNPHWEAALGKKGPFKRKVKGIYGDSVFFTDGSNSSMKYIKEDAAVNEGVKLSLVDPNTNKFIKTLSLDRTYVEAEKEIETLNRRLSPSQKTKGLYWKVTSIGESVNELKKLPNGNFSIKKGYNTFADYEKNAKPGDTILKYDKRGGMIKTFVSGSELHQNAKKYLSKVHSIVGDKVNLSLFGKQGYASVPDYEKKEVGVLVLESINEASHDLGNQEYTSRKLTPTQILDLAMAYANVPGKGNPMYNNKMEKMIKVANDLAKLTGAKQMNPKARGSEPALILFLLKNKLVTQDEYVKLYKNLSQKHISVAKALKNADPASRMIGGAAARQAHKDMRGEFDSE
jgi:hypothetical protein